HLAALPRMADFAMWSVACGLKDFETAYAHNCAEATRCMLEHDRLAQAVRALIAARGMWQGTASELVDTLAAVADIRNSKTLSDEVRRLAPLLRAVGIDVEHLRRTKDRRELRIIQRPASSASSE